MLLHACTVNDAATTVRIIGYVTPDEREALAKAARDDGRSVAAFIRAAIKDRIQYLEGRAS